MIPRRSEGIRVKSVWGWLARLSDKRSEVICLAKPEISLIKVVRTAVWETMVVPSETLSFSSCPLSFGRSTKVRSATRGERGNAEGGKGDREAKREGRLLVLTPAKAVQ